jgi:hypothetical protein
MSGLRPERERCVTVPYGLVVLHAPERRYLVLIEGPEVGADSACVPDLPG